MAKEDKATPPEELDSVEETQAAQEEASGEEASETAASEAAETAEAEGAAGDEIQDLHALLTDARNRADVNWDQCLRLQAELENLRKRSERDLANAHKFALEKFAAQLLPVKDSLEMGVAAAQEESADVAQLREGGELTLKMLTSVLEKFNINEINPLNEPFNPEYHEAMSTQERTDVEPNTVVTVVQKGYSLNDRLIRPAMVIVSRAAAQPAGGQINEQA
ncbi:MAG: nucleotide exchange factor GrpE [Gammaproteobacteria bacterium]|jgi:molecular chaperone GrpE